MGSLSIARGVIGGVAGAAGDSQTQQEMATANQQEQLRQQNLTRAKIAPFALNIKGLQTRLATAQPNTPEYNQIADEIQHNVHSMREVLHPDWKPGPSEWLKTHLTDRAHITNASQRERERIEKAQKVAGQENKVAGNAVDAVVPKTNPYVERKQELTQAGFTPEQTSRSLEQMAGITPKLTSDGTPYQGTDGKWYQNFKDSAGQITPREMPPTFTGPSTVDTRQRDDFHQFQRDHPTYKGSFEEWKKNPSGVDKPGTPRIGMSGGHNVYALLTDKGWVDAGTGAPLKDFRPLPTFAQQGLYGIDMMQHEDGTIGSALLNRRTGQFKPITSSGGAPIAPQIFAQVSKSIEPAIESDTRFRVMKDNEKDALNGNQQAMLSLVANHMGMTLGQQKGTRINQAQWNEAIASAPWIEAQAAKWVHQDANGDYIFDGFKSGVTITGDQVKQMVGLAQQRRMRQWQQAQQAGETYGVNVPVPDDLDHPSATLEGPKKKAIKGARAGQPSQSASGERKVGDVKKFPNGKTGVWDGTGWVAQ